MTAWKDRHFHSPNWQSAMSIEDNIKARQAADDAMSLLIDESKANGGRRFWNHLVTSMREMLGEDVFPDVEVVRDKAMSDLEARAFELEEMAFGKHVGLPMGQVPIDYMDWLDEQDDFRRRLNGYLRSGRCAEARREDGVDPLSRLV